MNGLNLSWHWSPGTLIFLVILCLLYGFAIRQARRRNAQVSIKNHQVVAFVIAIVTMALVLLTPIDTIARTQLFTAHMLQAVVLTTLCAPLLLFACPSWLLQPLIDQPVIGRIARILTYPLLASCIFNATFLTWHAPVLYHLALIHGTLYHVQMLSLLLAALLNWWPLIGPVRELRRLSYPIQMLYAFFDGQPVDVFAFLLVFTGTVFYPYYAIPSQLGISAVGDQAVGGALLLIPGLIDLVVMTPLFFLWLAQIEQQAKITDQRLQEEMEAEAARQEAEEGEATGIETSEA